MKFSPPPWLLSSLLVPVLLGVIFIGSRAGNALDLGGNEGMELSRAWLWSQRSAEVLRVEPDYQPGLYTRLLAAGFNLFGPGAAGARCFSLVSVTAMLVAIGWLLRQTVGAWGALVAGIFLFSAQGLLSLAMAALPGLPAIAWALVSIAFGYEPSRPPHWVRLVFSGLVWACAINLDASVWLLGPAFLVLMFRAWRWKAAIKSLGFWIMGWAAASLLVALTAPTFNGKLLLGLSPQSDLTPSGFHWNALLMNPALLLAALCGIWQTIKRKAPATLLFALVWLAAVLLLAKVWGVWPASGSLQFYASLAILGAAGWAATLSVAVTVFRSAANQPANKESRSFFDGNGLNALGAITIFAFWVGFAVPNFVSGLGWLTQLPSAKHDGLCLSIRKYAAATRWGYTRFPEYAFAGGVFLLPELTTPRAIAWPERNPAGQSALNVVQHYQPEQLLLAGNVEMHNPAWAAWTTNHYVLVYQDGQKELWVSRRLHPAPIPASNALLRKMGL